MPDLGLIPKQRSANPTNNRPRGKRVIPSTLQAPPRSSRVLAQQQNSSRLLLRGIAATGTQFSGT